MSDYASYLSARCDDWRAKYPRRGAELRTLVRRWLGIQPTIQSALADATVVSVENDVIRLMLGWPTATEWEPQLTGGQDRALPRGDQ